MGLKNTAGRGIIYVLALAVTGLALAMASPGETYAATGQSGGDTGSKATSDTHAGSGLKITPPIAEITVEKGASKVVEVSVQNLTGAEIKVLTVANDFLPSSDESGQPRLILDKTELAPPTSFKTIVQPTQPVTLGPHERQTIPVTITVPETSASGGYYGAVRFSPSQDNLDSNIAMTADVGTVFLVKVPGNLIEKLTIESFDIVRGSKPGTVFGYGALSVQTRFRNGGNIHVQPFGKIYIKNFTGKVIQEIEVNNAQPRGNVLPDSVRKFTSPITVKRMYGRYTAEASFGYGTNGELLVVKKTFYVIPYNLVVLIVIAILFAIFGLPRLLKYYKGYRSRKPDI